jgi:hypothetical protein
MRQGRAHECEGGRFFMWMGGVWVFLGGLAGLCDMNLICIF